MAKSEMGGVLTAAIRRGEGISEKKHRLAKCLAIAAAAKRRAGGIAGVSGDGGGNKSAA
jgi:hypothetical protein